MTPENKDLNTYSSPMGGGCESAGGWALHLADNTLILGHRNSEWTGHGPVLEQDIALSNIALDLIGQARNFYQYAAKLRNDGSTEDSLAYLRSAGEFKNFLLVEQPNGHWGKTILRQFLFSTYQYYLYLQIQNGSDEVLASIAEKAIKEVRYHIRWSGEWVIRLGAGTEESHSKMKNALDELWIYTRELFIPASNETRVGSNGLKIDYESIKKDWNTQINQTLREATLSIPEVETTGVPALGKEGHHSPYLEQLLSEMQYMQRTYPGCEW